MMRRKTIIRNAMGDVIGLYTAEGTLVGTYEYDPYGKLLAVTSFIHDYMASKLQFPLCKKQYMQL